jgi:hypothetical protein
MNPLGNVMDVLPKSDLIEGLEAARDDLNAKGAYDPMSFVVAALVDQAIKRLRQC